MIRDNGKVNLIDCDGMLHIVANVQFAAGNRDNASGVKDHVRRFYATIRKNADCQYSIAFYQKQGHKNFRKNILPEYKGTRVPSEAVLLWKDTVIETFNELGAYGLEYVESDDIIAALAPVIGSDRIVITSSDKDMQQVVGEHYNPFKRGSASDDSRWFYINKYKANRFLYEQTLSGDGGDMPLALCGIAGIGPATATKLCNTNSPYGEVIAEQYTKKYGAVLGLQRAALTYKMVRLLTGSPEDAYAGPNAVQEIAYVLHNFRTYIKEVANDVNALFGIQSTKGADLFKS